MRVVGDGGAFIGGVGAAPAGLVRSEIVVGGSGEGDRTGDRRSVIGGAIIERVAARGEHCTGFGCAQAGFGEGHVIGATQPHGARLAVAHVAEEPGAAIGAAHLQVEIVAVGIGARAGELLHQLGRERLAL